MQEPKELLNRCFIEHLLGRLQKYLARLKQFSQCSMMDDNTMISDHCDKEMSVHCRTKFFHLINHSVAFRPLGTSLHFHPSLEADAGSCSALGVGNYTVQNRQEC